MENDNGKKIGDMTVSDLFWLSVKGVIIFFITKFGLMILGALLWWYMIANLS